MQIANTLLALKYKGDAVARCLVAIRYGHQQETELIERLTSSPSSSSSSLPSSDSLSPPPWESVGSAGFFAALQARRQSFSRIQADFSASSVNRYLFFSSRSILAQRSRHVASDSVGHTSASLRSPRITLSFTYSLAGHLAPCGNTVFGCLMGQIALILFSSCLYVVEGYITCQSPAKGYV